MGCGRQSCSIYKIGGTDLKRNEDDNNEVELEDWNGSNNDSNNTEHHWTIPRLILLYYLSTISSKYHELHWTIPRLSLRYEILYVYKTIPVYDVNTLSFVGPCQGSVYCM